MKRYRAKRKTDVYVESRPGEAVTLEMFYKGEVLLFNPDDFEEVEEEKTVSVCCKSKVKVGWNDIVGGCYVCENCKKEVCEVEEGEIELPKYLISYDEHSWIGWAREITDAVNKLKKGREL